MTRVTDIISQRYKTTTAAYELSACDTPNVAVYDTVHTHTFLAYGCKSAKIFTLTNLTFVEDIFGSPKIQGLGFRKYIFFFLIVSSFSRNRRKSF